MKNRSVTVWAATLTVISGLALAVGAETTAPATPAPAGAPAVVATSAVRQQSSLTLWSLIKSGGWAMWPLGACSVLTVGLTILNFMRVSQRKMIPEGVVSQLKVSATAGDFQRVWDMSSSTDTFFTKSLTAGLRKIQPDNPLASRNAVEAAISETAGREESRYAFFVNFLSLMTSMSPMWGLLGTVSGMIGAFSKIGEGGMGKPEMLAKNIGEALVCTATGLLIAITAMGMYFLFRNILNTVMKESEGHFTDILDNLMGVANPAGQSAETETAPAAAQSQGA